MSKMCEIFVPFKWEKSCNLRNFSIFWLSEEVELEYKISPTSILSATITESGAIRPPIGFAIVGRPVQLQPIYECHGNAKIFPEKFWFKSSVRRFSKSCGYIVVRSWPWYEKSVPGDQVQSNNPTEKIAEIFTTISWDILEKIAPRPMVKKIPSTSMSTPIHFCGSRYHCHIGIFCAIQSVKSRSIGEAIPIPKINAKNPKIPPTRAIFLDFWNALYKPKSEIAKITNPAINQKADKNPTFA